MVEGVRLKIDAVTECDNADREETPDMKSEEQEERM